MEFEINVLLWVDPDANFIDVHEDHSFCVERLVRDILYDVDDVKVKDCEVTRHDN
jgi:hypothetical protein